MTLHFYDAPSTISSTPLPGVYSGWAISQRPTKVLIEELAGENAAVARVRFGNLSVTGESKRNKGERKQADVGLDLALARALYRLADELTDRAYANLES